MFSWGVLLVAVPMFYLASVGPILYLLERQYGGLINAPDPVLYSVFYFYYPVDFVAEVFPPFDDYAEWFRNRGEDAWRTAKEAADKEQ